MPTFSEQLRLARSRVHPEYTQREAAELLRIPVTTYRSWERMKSPAVPLELAQIEALRRLQDARQDYYVNALNAADPVATIQKNGEVLP